jgi:hypothetical protein
MAAIIRILPCTNPTDYNKSKVAPCAWAQPALAVAGFAQTQFQLLELSHVCTFQPDRPGRSV